MSLDYNKFIDFWQGVVAQSVYEQGQDLLSYAESLQDSRTRLNLDRDAAIAATHLTVVVATKPTGRKNERTFTSLSLALNFAAEVLGQVKFSVDKDEFKVVWYDKEVQ